MSPPCDLNSIYRLEFYKKQKNWKFCTSRQSREKSQKPKKYGKKTTLNLTYNIDDGNAQKYFDLHNTAFINSIQPLSAPVEETTSNILSASTDRLSITRQQPIHICPNTETQDDQCEFKKPLSNIICKRLAALQLAAELHKEDINNNQNELKETDTSEKWSEGLDCNDPMHTECAAHVDTIAQEAEYGMSEPSSSRVMSQCHQTDRPGMDIVKGDWIDSSVDSEGEFMRGAHAAPHSSEIELSLSSISSAMSCNELSRLSSRQLGAAAHHYSQALRRLFIEANLRQKLKKPPTDYIVSLDYDKVLASSYLQEMRSRNNSDQTNSLHIL